MVGQQYLVFLNSFNLYDFLATLNVTFPPSQKKLGFISQALFCFYICIHTNEFK